MASIKTIVTTGVLTLVAVMSLALPGSADAAQRAVVKKKTHAAAKHVAAPRMARHVSLHASRRVNARHIVSVVRIEPARPSFGQLYGLHNTADTLELKSSVALVLDQDTNEVLFSKNSQAVLPIASLTKLRSEERRVGKECA